MTRVDEFSSFYTSTAADALRVTYALCGDRQVALEATVDAYRRAWRDWSKIRERDPLGHVRNEAWKATALSRTTHPLRRRHEEDADTVLLGALHDLPTDDRRLIVLLTLGDTDLEQACREVGVGQEDGIEIVTNALTRLEQQVGVPLHELEARLRDLGSITGQLAMPPVATLRQRADRGRRLNTVLLVAIAVVAVLGSAAVATDGGDLTTRSDVPRREKIGAESADVVLEARKLSDENLLNARQVGGLDQGGRWRVTDTSEDREERAPYATCPTRRFANDDPLRVFVRTFSGDGAGSPRAAQAIEVSRDDQAATKAFQRTLGWYANCQQPRIQLIGSYVVKRPFGDFQVLRLRSNRSPERIITVGFATSGRVTLTLVHEVAGTRPPTTTDFARTLNASVSKICRDSGGRCSDDFEVSAAPPPRTDTAPAFLGVVDLPPVGRIDRVWAGVDPFRPEKGKNPAATVCDAADFFGDDVEDVRSRVFVIPGARLPQEFGVAETVGRFASQDDAKSFVSTVKDKVKGCPDDNLSAKISQRTSVKGDGFSGTSWRIGFEITKGQWVYYRMAVVRRGDVVAQTTFTPAGQNDIGKGAFTELAARAGERLVYAD
ncbi:MAG: hypothetical protein PGN07_02780 [Aeromicrobium erythreum]